jgi:hypothetical protein
VAKDWRCSGGAASGGLQAGPEGRLASKEAEQRRNMVGHMAVSYRVAHDQSRVRAVPK